MKRSELLNIAQAAIIIRKASCSDKWAVCYHKGAVICLPTTSTCKPEIVFGIYSALELEVGLTSKQWALLELHMYTFLSEKGLCEKQLKL